MVESNYKKTYTISESIDNAISECINRIKNKKFISDNNIKLISEKEGVDIAKKFFEEYCNNKISDVVEKKDLWFDWQVEDNILMLNVLYSQLSYNKEKVVYPEIIATILVDLISGKCGIYNE